MSAVGRLLICPTTGCFPVQPHLQKCLGFSLDPNQQYIDCRPVPKGALAIVTDAERDAVDAGGRTARYHRGLSGEHVNGGMGLATLACSAVS